MNLERFTSRKFIVAVATGLIGVLAALGVFDASAQETLLAQAPGFAYLLIQGVRDFFVD
jgi:hypothetical protein